eukprot:7518038-Pyramimonas_sp.AAC.1
MMMTQATASVSTAGESSTAKGVLTTVNVSCGRGLTEFLAETPVGDLFAVHEHRALGDKLSSLLGQVRDLGYRG